MIEIPVDLGARSYQIAVDSGILAKAGFMLRQVSSSRQVFLISNPTVFSLYGELAVKSLEENDFQVSVGLMPDGEEYKNMDEAMNLLDLAADIALERTAVIAALGGGVVGDMAGFVAAIYQRGVDFIQFPTTLLAQVDSSIGGKVAVNHPRGKNLIGAFHQPRKVIIDPLCLNTLAEEEYQAGLGEIIKYGIVYDRSFFEYMEEELESLKNRSIDCIQNLIMRSCMIKRDIVQEDEKETGLRMILNLGHTFGHALEKLGNYQRYKHGIAVAKGIIMASYLAQELGYLNLDERERIEKLIEDLHINADISWMNSNSIYEAMLNDKKVVNGKLRLILPRGIGDYIILDDVPRDKIIAAIEAALD